MEDKLNLCAAACSDKGARSLAGLHEAPSAQRQRDDAAQHMGGNVTQMAHSRVQGHSRALSLPRNSFPSKTVGVFKLMLLVGKYQCQHFLNWKTRLGT